MAFLASQAIDYHNITDGSVAGWVESALPTTILAIAPPAETATRESDAELIDIVWPYVAGLRKYLCGRVPAADVDDVLQDVLLNIIRRGDDAVVTHPKCYLYRAAQATLIDRFRRQTARHAANHCELHEAAHPVDHHSPLRILLAKNDVVAAEDVLQQLPERTQEIMVAIRIEGSSLKSLADKYRISTSAIEKHVTKAAKALAQVRYDSVAIQRRHSSPAQRSAFQSFSHLESEKIT